MKETYFISDEQQRIYKKYLDTRGYEEVARRSGYSFSTVNNILNKRVPVNPKTEIVVRTFNQLVLERVTRMAEELGMFKQKIEQDEPES